MTAGVMQLTMTPERAVSLARDFVRAMTPALEAL